MAVNGSNNVLAVVVGRFGAVYAELGQLNEAWRCIGEAMSIVETAKERWFEAEVNRIAGAIALKSPEPDAAKAEEYFDRALVTARQQQAKSWELRAAMSLARLWRDRGKQQQARELLAPVYGWFTKGFDTLDLRRRRRYWRSWGPKRLVGNKATCVPRELCARSERWSHQLHQPPH